MALIRHIIELIINPFFLALLLLGICTFLAWRRTHEHFVRVGLLLLFIILIVCSTGWLPNALGDRLENQYPVVTAIDPNIKWVVVLGGGQWEAEGMPVNDLLTSASIERVIEGIRLFKELPQSILVLSGGAEKPDEPEAKKLGRLAQLLAVPANKIVLEQNSINTADQAREIKHIVREQPFYLVTSAMHMPRAMALCQAEGLYPIAAPTDFNFLGMDGPFEKMIIPNTYNLAHLSMILHELLGRAWATLSKNR